MVAHIGLDVGDNFNIPILAIELAIRSLQADIFSPGFGLGKPPVMNKFIFNSSISKIFTLSSFKFDL